MLSQKGKYAIRAVLYLAIESNPLDGLKGAHQVAEELNLPLAFIRKILQELAREHIVSSQKGPGGGFYLSKENLKIPMIQLIRAAGDGDYFDKCGLGLEKCSEERPCPIHHVFKKSKVSLLALFESKTIGDLARDAKYSNLYLKG